MAGFITAQLRYIAKGEQVAKEKDSEESGSPFVRMQEGSRRLMQPARLTGDFYVRIVWRYITQATECVQAKFGDFMCTQSVIVSDDVVFPAADSPLVEFVRRRPDAIGAVAPAPYMDGSELRTNSIVVPPSAKHPQDNESLPFYCEIVPRGGLAIYIRAPRSKMKPEEFEAELRRALGCARMLELDLIRNRKTPAWLYGGIGFWLYLQSLQRAKRQREVKSLIAHTSITDDLAKLLDPTRMSSYSGEVLRTGYHVVERYMTCGRTLSSILLERVDPSWEDALENVLRAHRR